MLLNGYFAPDPPRRDVFVYCPDCRHPVHAVMNLRSRGGTAATAVLVAALVDHWYAGECAP